MAAVIGILLGGFTSIIFLATGLWQGALASGIAFIVSLIIPFEGFDNKRCVDTIQLINLKRDMKKEFYVEVRGKKAYFAYDISNEYDLEDVLYHEVYVRRNVKICESNKCELPILKKFVSKPNRIIWAVALIPNKVEYVFYVPKGTVLYVKSNKSTEKKSPEVIV